MRRVERKKFYYFFVYECVDENIFLNHLGVKYCVIKNPQYLMTKLHQYLP